MMQPCLGPDRLRLAESNRPGRALPACGMPGMPQVKNRFCARICARDAAGQAETGEMQQHAHEHERLVGQGKHARWRRTGTPETGVVVLITQRRQQGVRSQVNVSLGVLVVCPSNGVDNNESRSLITVTLHRRSPGADWASSAATVPGNGPAGACSDDHLGTKLVEPRCVKSRSFLYETSAVYPPLPELRPMLAQQLTRPGSPQTVEGGARMRAGAEDDDVVYHGYRRQPSEQIIELETQAGVKIGVLQHVVRHSPTGMNWGYVGAGPCDTALSLLLDVLGAKAICRLCHGSQRIVYIPEGTSYRAEPFDPVLHGSARRGWACECWGGYIDVPYGDFVDEFAANWGDEWTISRWKILSWLEPKIRAGHD